MQHNELTFLEQIRALQPVFMPGWMPGQGEAGWAVAQTFAPVVDGLNRQLGALPEKLFIAYLDALGTTPNPALSARVPVTFAVTENYRGEVAVPEGTPVATKTKVPFETERAFTATSAKLTAVVSADPAAVRVCDHSASLEEGSVMTWFDEAAEEQYLYFGDDHLFDFYRKATDPNAGMELRVPLLGNGTWEFYGREGAEGETEWIPFEGSGQTLNKKGVHATVKTERNGIESYWIRFKPLPGSATVPAALFGFNSRSSTDALYSNDMPINPESSSFMPFGALPQNNSTFYIASGEAFSKKGFVVKIDAEYTVSVTDTDLSWEYFNGKAWKPLPLIKGGEGYRFSVPSDLAPTQVNGEENLWIRVRLLGSRVTYECSGGELVVAPNAPVIRHMEIYVEPKNAVAQHALRYAFRVFTPLESGGAVYQGLSQPNQSVYFGFDRPPGAGLITLFLELADSGASPGSPLLWSYEGPEGFVPFSVEDGTAGLTKSGICAFIAPADGVVSERFGTACWWLRAERPGGIGGLEVRGLHLNTVMARQARSYDGVLLGSSDGTPSQSFTLAESPALELGIRVLEPFAPEGADAVEDAYGEGAWVLWSATSRLEGCGAEDRVYTFDPVSGRIGFGDGIHGKIPPSAADGLHAAYRIGGGAAGNVAAESVDSLGRTIARIDGVSNPVQATGGAEMQSLEALKRLAPKRLKHGFRSVTGEDYRMLAFEASEDVAEASVRTGPGSVELALVPKGEEAAPMPSRGLLERVEGYLRERAPLTAAVTVRAPEYVRVSVGVSVAVSDWGAAATVKTALDEGLAGFLHPMQGGPDGSGWRFGTLPTLAALYRLVAETEGVAYFENLTVRVETSGGILASLERPVGPECLVCSGTHTIEVRGA